MAFCNSCGAAVDPGAKFCAGCGAPAPAAAAPASGPSVATPAPPTSGGGGALKIILIVVGVLVALGILGAAGAGVFAYYMAKSSHIHQQGDRVKVETPLGTVEANQNSEQNARRMGVDIYPGAKALESGGVTAGFGGMKTLAAQFESSDSPQQVAAFYKNKFPNATITESQADHYSLVSTGERGLTTISVTPLDGKTRIAIAVVGSGSSGSETN